jgi:hypothetical protein
MQRFPRWQKVGSSQLGWIFGIPMDRAFGDFRGIRDVRELRHFVWVKLGILVEQTSGRRFSHQSSPFLERSSAAPCGTDIVYIKLIVMALCGRMRYGAVECGMRKITFRVRCIQPGSATSPRVNFICFCYLIIYVSCSLSPQKLRWLIWCPFDFALHQTINCRSLVLRSKIGAPHDNLERCVPGQLCNGAQIYHGQNKFTGKGMAVAMPAIGIDLRLFECGHT